MYKKHLRDTLNLHERSTTHQNSPNSYFMTQNNINIDQMVFANESSLKSMEVMKNRHFVDRIFDVIKLLGI